MSTMHNMNSFEPHGSAIAPMGRLFTFTEYEVVRDVVVPAMTKAEAEAWIKARAPRMRGNPREAVMWFLTRRWELCAGTRIRARYVSFYNVVVAIGGVDALGRFMRKPNATMRFSYHSAQRVLSLVVERINQTAI